MNIKKCICLSVVVFVALFGLTACSNGSTKVGWVGSNYPGHFSASFNSFTGTDSSTIRLNEGDILTISYESEIKDGFFEISIIDPDGEKVTGININEQGKEEVVAHKSGRYKLVLDAEKAKGHFQFEW